jgi:pyruvate,orthophosphate dikinase
VQVTDVDSLAVSYVYAFDHKHRRPPMEYKDLLGGKGANLAEMTRC